MKSIAFKQLFILISTIFVSSTVLASGSYNSNAAVEKDIVDTAIAAGSFNTLATALSEADLIDALKSQGPFTVFAPTDEAFSRIPADQLEAIMADKELLTSILSYHVVLGKVMAKDVANISSAATLQGTNINISTDNGVTINNAKVTKTNSLSSNGVIHEIDTVLLPDNNFGSAAE